jgi:cell fate (sporulation/competence/biofilm development) regulator YlbF (YheA/YmcA/DUF963 family)
MRAIKVAVVVVEDERRDQMILPNEIKRVAQKLGQSLRETPEVAAYLQAVQAVQDNPQAAALEEAFLALYQNLVAKQRDGQALDPTELNEYSQLREQVRFNPLIAARDDQLQMVKLVLSDAGQMMTATLGVDFSALAG